ncbi:Rubrerythrin [Geoglobus ahangari]|uniref:Rubrerythrin n=1 Tax=Geoglobus ahangari TaxID=113653 RepID=A0A0F7IHB4_9EURY|nr:rubrerythrin family protein [Geoglobus ahangari]AKG92329.1 Rubrerythrin [Geoglobus ahangari]
MSTEENLKGAFAGESQASVKYRIFAELAKEKGLRNLARVFEAFSFSEFVHAKNHLKNLRDLDDPVANLEEAIKGETYEVEEMYPKFYEEAIKENKKRAATSFRWAMEAEKEHAEVYRRLKVLVESGRDKAFEEKIYVCPTCGYIFVGEAPEVCPLCSVSRETFRVF